MYKKNIRIIPRLDIKGPNLVKGIHLEGLKILGSPDQFSNYYYDNGADELLYVDSVASLYGRNSLHDIIEKTSKKIFIPITVGGGLRTIEDISSVLRCGADKVAINTEAVNNKSFIKKSVEKFGSSTIVIEIQIKKQLNGNYVAFTDNGRNNSGLDVFEWAKCVESLGVGELLITSIDRDGTGLGFDINIIDEISKNVKIPVIASGGASKNEDIISLCNKTNIDGVALASMLHYPLIDKFKDSNFSGNQVGEFKVIQDNYTNSKIEGSNIKSIKKFLFENKIQCREYND